MLECVAYTLGVGSLSVVPISEISPQQLALGVWLTMPEWNVEGMTKDAK